MKDHDKCMRDGCGHPRSTHVDGHKDCGAWMRCEDSECVRSEHTMSCCCPEFLVHRMYRVVTEEIIATNAIRHRISMRVQEALTAGPDGGLSSEEMRLYGAIAKAVSVEIRRLEKEIEEREIAYRGEG